MLEIEITGHEWDCESRIHYYIAGHDGIKICLCREIVDDLKDLVKEKLDRIAKC